VISPGVAPSEATTRAAAHHRPVKVARH